MEIPTIKVVSDNEQGFKVINEGDKKPSDVIYEPKKTNKRKEKELANGKL